ncbi:MAG: hypothetical protein GY696_11885, partial [Gammaproteobacteria bacterium]|nr:hypothetical protein [Gammaproteobacteria bacterium]
RWVVPAGLKLQLLRQYHEDLGHFGVNKVQKLLSRKYYWIRLTADVQNHIRTCISCQKRKTPIPKPNPPLQSITIPGPFHTIAADILELPLTQDGNRYALVFVDMFTKWPEAVALPDQTAERVAKHFMELVVCRFGSPIRLLTD